LDANSRNPLPRTEQTLHGNSLFKAAVSKCERQQPQF
jgi:hypothetical protein